MLSFAIKFGSSVAVIDHLGGPLPLWSSVCFSIGVALSGASTGVLLASAYLIISHAVEYLFLPATFVFNYNFGLGISGR